MSLKEYRAKRDFSNTPEPPGRQQVKPAGRPRFFCVQKHLASHLHYDLRLEHDGVLLSWAVPKGPSLDPSVKRLAMKVEDHPIEYGEFEGVIPSGYGAGIVMLWDRGTWTPEVEDVDAALRKGDLKVQLDGYKLKGSWVLVHTRGAGDRGWLLIKHRDDWAGPIDITEFAPLSVKTNQDFADILAEATPDIWLANRPAKAGETGRMFERIIERALDIKASRETTSARAPRARTSRSVAESKPAKRSERKQSRRRSAGPARSTSKAGRRRP